MSEMNNDRRTEDLLATIDNELKAALSVAPSADFEARVLRTIEERAEARRSWWIPSYAFVATAAAVVLTTTMAVVMMRPAREIESAPPQIAGSDVQLPAQMVRLKADPTSIPDTPVRLKPHPRAATVRRASDAPVGSAFRRTTPAEPEVLVPLNQLAAVRRLVRDVNAGRITEIPGESAPSAGAPTEVAVAPLVVDPIVVPDAEKGGGISPVVRGF